MRALKKAVDSLYEENLVCVIVNKKGIVVQTSRETGIKPLASLLQADENALKGMYVADKIIGKAAACLLIIGRAKAVYGHIMSDTAKELLDQNHIPYTCKELVPYIQNKDKTGMCPMEEKVKDVKSAQDGAEILLQFFKDMAK